MDRGLVEAAKHGSREAYDLLGSAVARQLYPVAFRILRDAAQADDAVEQALVSIWRDLPKLRDPAGLADRASEGLLSPDEES